MEVYVSRMKQWFKLIMMMKSLVEELKKLSVDRKLNVLDAYTILDRICIEYGYDLDLSGISIVVSRNKKSLRTV